MPPAKLPAIASRSSDKHVFSDTVTEIYDGTWTATFDRSVGATGTAKLVLEDFAGTWQDVGPANRLKGSALRRKTDARDGAAEPEGRASPSRCSAPPFRPSVPILTVYVKHVDAKTLEGTVESKAFDGEQKIRLVRTPQAPRRR